MNITTDACQPCKQQQTLKQSRLHISCDPSLSCLLLKSVDRHSLWCKCIVIVDIFYSRGIINSSVQSEGRDHCPCQQAPRDVLNGDGVSSVKIQTTLRLARCFNVFQWIILDLALPKAVYTVSQCIYSFINRVSQSLVPHTRNLQGMKRSCVPGQ